MVNTHQTLREKIAQVLYEEPAAISREDFTSWVLLTDERRKPWLEDAERIIELLYAQDKRFCKYALGRSGVDWLAIDPDELWRDFLGNDHEGQSDNNAETPTCLHNLSRYELIDIVKEHGNTAAQLRIALEKANIEKAGHASESAELIGLLQDTRSEIDQINRQFRIWMRQLLEFLDSDQYYQLPQDLRDWWQKSSASTENTSNE